MDADEQRAICAIPLQAMMLRARNSAEWCVCFENVSNEGQFSKADRHHPMGKRARASVHDSSASSRNDSAMNYQPFAMYSATMSDVTSGSSHL
jgi:hypothetical protein